MDLSNLASSYRAQVEAANALRAAAEGQDRWAGPVVQRLSGDPRREPSALFLGIASYVQPEDLVIDVGGGAGRHGLPLARRCKEVINVDPSGGMRAEFEAMAGKAGIGNARFVQSDWLSAEGIEGDVGLVSSVTYFIPDIVPFIEKLNNAVRRRVIICMISLPTPNYLPSLFKALHGRPLPLVPGYRELLPVLWEMGILPEVHVFPFDMHNEVAPDQEGGIQRALTMAQFRSADETRVRSLLEDHFDELFATVAGGFTLRANLSNREILITWSTA